MISLELFIVLLIGTAVMLIPIMIQSKWYQIKLWKSIPIAFILTIAGTVGTKIWFLIENGNIAGQSFYGAVFVVPFVFLLIAKLVRVPYDQLMDLCAPAECAMLGIMKTQCFTSGCCGGREVFVNAQGTAIIFPSQIVELITALVILVALMLLSRKDQNRGMIYPLYMVIYGATRFVLNYFRAGDGVFALGLAPGAFWSVCALLLGVVWLVINKAKMQSAEKKERI